MTTKLLKRTAIAAVCTAALFTSAGAVSSADIKKDLDEAIQKRETAHQLAENARALGADEHHYTIWYAKKMWSEHNEIVKELTNEYNAAKEEENSKKDIGMFRVSFYTSSPAENGGSTVTATGASLAGNEWKVCAVDPSVIPLGSRIYVEGLGEFRCLDTGGAIKGAKLDVLVNRGEAERLGIQYRRVYLMR